MLAALLVCSTAVSASGQDLPAETFADLTLKILTYHQGLEDRLDAHSRLTRIAGDVWRMPRYDLMIVILAARVGEPEASPASATWAQLAAAIKGRKHAVELDRILEMAAGLRLQERVHRGLAIVRSIFPELGKLIPSRRLEVPAWERLALRLAASRLVKAAIADEA